MIRRISLISIVIVGVFALASAGCKHEGATPAKGTTTAKAASDRGDTEAAAKKAPDAAKPTDTPKSAQAATAKAGPAPPAKGGDHAKAAPGQTKPRDPSLTESECKKACEHAKKLSLASLPPSAKPAMKAAIEKALTETCPKQCLLKGTKASVSCVLNAKTAMDLGNCH